MVAAQRVFVGEFRVMRVVVTGSAGRVGRAVFVRLSREHDVVGLDRLPASTAVDHVGDIADCDLLAAAFAGADAVVHVAALHAPHVGVVSDAEFERVNVGGTHAVLDAAVRAHVRRIVFTSTTALYGCADRTEQRAAWIDEDVEPRPLTVYHRSKLEAERLLRESAARGGPEVRILRMSRCFPEPADVMAVYRLHRGIDARDVADAHALALSDKGGRHATWVISGETPFTRADVARLACDARALLRERAPDLVSAFDARGWTLPARIDRVYDTTRAMRELGWRPRYDFREVLAMLNSEIAEVLPPSSASGVRCS
jgi:nucleoside-diphosphate-sugar epimerase